VLGIALDCERHTIENDQAPEPQAQILDHKLTHTTYGSGDIA